MTVGSIVTGGFRLVWERPGALLVWFVVQFGLAVATSYAMLGIYEQQNAAALAGATQAELDMAYLWRSVPMGVVALVVSSILYAAAQRAVLRPREGGPGGLRLGMDEVRLFLLAALYMLVSIVALVLLGFAMVLFGWGAGAGTRAAATIMFLAIVAVLGSYFAVKLSLTFPMTLLRRRFAVDEGWRLTNGHFWTLFGAFLILFVILLVAGLATLAATEWDYVSAALRYGSDSESAAFAVEREMLKLRDFGPDLDIVLKWALTAAQGALAFALLGGATATAALELTADEEGLGETFA